MLNVQQYCSSRWFQIYDLKVTRNRAETCSKYFDLIIKFELLWTIWALFPFIWIHNRTYKPVSHSFSTRFAKWSLSEMSPFCQNCFYPSYVSSLAAPMISLSQQYKMAQSYISLSHSSFL